MAQAEWPNDEDDPSSWELDEDGDSDDEDGDSDDEPDDEETNDAGSNK